MQNERNSIEQNSRNIIIAKQNSKRFRNALDALENKQKSAKIQKSRNVLKNRKLCNKLSS